jgi:putative aldouronate transport system substrate-binding protein
LWKDLYPSKDELPESPWGAAYNLPVPVGSKLEVNNKRMQDITFKRVPEAILAEPEKFDGIWDQFMKDLDKVGVEESEEEFTQIVKDTVELWND